MPLPKSHSNTAFVEIPADWLVNVTSKGLQPCEVEISKAAFGWASVMEVTNNDSRNGIRFDFIGKMTDQGEKYSQ